MGLHDWQGRAISPFRVRPSRSDDSCLTPSTKKSREEPTMKLSGVAGAALAVAGLLMADRPAAHAQDGGFTAQVVIDRAEIEDLLQRYYANFGKAESESFSAFYADDAQFVLGTRSYKGKEEIAGAYKAVRTNGQSPSQGRFSFNVLMTN